jgi:hypothetical protein
MCIWRTEELCEYPEYPISYEEYSTRSSWCASRFLLIVSIEQHDREEHNTLEKCLKEWTRKIRDTIFYDSKWSAIGGISQKFLIYSVADTTESESEREDRHEDIGYIEEPIVISPSEEYHSEYDSESPTMEAHATLPYREYIGRMIDEILKIIKTHITEPPSEDDTEKYRKKKYIPVFLLYRSVSFDICIAEKKSHSIHESIPCRGYTETEK